MVISTVPPTHTGSPTNDSLPQFSPSDQVALLRGDVLLQSQPQPTGGSVTEHKYGP
ncbi:MAG: hypothetical protein AAFW95_08915 [Cyanobacteria bacterium J06638_6]